MSEVVCLSPRAAGLSHMLPAWLPPPERGRVGVGVHSTMWSAAVCLGNWQSETPSRLAALADLPLSGGGEDTTAAICGCSADCGERSDCGAIRVRGTFRKLL